MGGLGALGGTDLSLSNSSSARADAKAAQMGSLGSFGNRGFTQGNVGGIGSGGIDTTTLAIAAAVIIGAVWFIMKRR